MRVEQRVDQRLGGRVPNKPHLDLWERHGEHTHTLFFTHAFKFSLQFHIAGFFCLCRRSFPRCVLTRFRYIEGVEDRGHLRVPESNCQ